MSSGYSLLTHKGEPRELLANSYYCEMIQLSSTCHSGLHINNNNNSVQYKYKLQQRIILKHSCDILYMNINNGRMSLG